MTRLARPRRTPVAALFAVVLVYLVAGHAYHPGETMDEAATGAGICILLVTALSSALLARPPRVAAPLRDLPVAAPPARLLKSTPLPRARASPQWLQRFLN